MVLKKVDAKDEGGSYLDSVSIQWGGSYLGQKDE